MTRRKLCLWIQAALCVLLCALLAAGAVSIWSEGVRRQEAGDALAWIYTRDQAAERLGRIAPLFWGTVGFMLACLAAGVRDDSQDRPGQNLRTEDVRRGTAAGKAENSRLILVVRVCVLAAAAACILHGVFNGSLHDVLIKAVNLCTECVGLG